MEAIPLTTSVEKRNGGKGGKRAKMDMLESFHLCSAIAQLAREAELGGLELRNVEMVNERQGNSL